MRILVTGCAGFIGSSLCQRLPGDIIGIDNLSDYYDVELKRSRLQRLRIDFHEHDLVNPIDLGEVDVIFHLAAQAGVRYSLTHPWSYIDSNIVGFLNVLEYAKRCGAHLFYASSSSVYGHNDVYPFVETAKTDTPASLYGATKKSNELMAYAYSSLYGFPVTGMRFFTVYGPWGRPDMALFKFTENILKDESIDLFNGGAHLRDFTYIDDILDGIEILFNSRSEGVFNIASGRPIALLDFVEEIEKALGKKAKKNYLSFQRGDVETTHGDITALKRLGYSPKVSLSEGVGNFCEWYKSYYGG